MQHYENSGKREAGCNLVVWVATLCLLLLTRRQLDLPGPANPVPTAISRKPAVEQKIGVVVVAN